MKRYSSDGKWLVGLLLALVVVLNPILATAGASTESSIGMEFRDTPRLGMEFLYQRKVRYAASLESRRAGNQRGCLSG